MIGVFRTTHPTEGYSISIRYSRVNSIIRILGIHSNGKDIWGKLSLGDISILKSRIPLH